MPNVTSKKLILLAEDNETSAKLTIRTLEEAGYEVAHAINGRDAYEMATDLLPHLIIMDVMMPQMDGLMSLRLIRTNHKLRETPVVMLTVLEDAGERCIEAGANECVEKTRLRDSLVNTVDRYLKYERPPAV